MKKFMIFRLIQSTGLYITKEKRFITETNTFEEAMTEYRKLKRANRKHTYKIECCERIGD
jgi:hypothetical protein